ncbi:MAG: phosphatidylglycerophosphatase A [Chlorobium sp.]|jgi:phosphatidylglycerophosphatase A|uniref:phosphatidylglycerophosphatase A family protein n=1 Tax=Chlorobium sp. TaxID=1095 RepID=UPI001D583C7C|nr:phosphatidylglycerophosphatase A [Chlorobium sp.]MBN1279246.1 phosphatidylglycerophosphatase A [Chlorobiaceae bacterium]MCF8216847.1 phosphatidylglycerophosphatase A [Chlorobium sp.]MCF8271692.1 phosphatidylglycerophosphatase A [Chlorobium sp.]MCF8288064.1 phosphatidylglycerophosphatase A [Chlorobium sp.]MCF8291648.1 phosphatidylglycerophosphatase A [Chlorobium sp.]
MVFNIARLLATCFGLGYTPLAPGTVVSAAAVLCYCFIPAIQDLRLLIPLVCVVTAAGIWSGQIMEKRHGEDPSIVTIDELVGQWIALAAMPATLPVLLLAFVSFRFFDIAKPGPIDRVQRLNGGWGIMADDLLAGFFANLSVRTIMGVAAYVQMVLPL